MTGHTALPWRNDQAAGQLATIGLAVALHRAGHPAGVYTGCDGQAAVAAQLDDVAAVLAAETAWATLAEMSICPTSTKYTADMWAADVAAGRDLGAWVESIGWPHHDPELKRAITPHPFLRGMAARSTLTLHTRSMHHQVTNVGWQQVIEHGLVVQLDDRTSATTVGWDWATQRRTGVDPTGVIRPAVELLCALSLLALPNLPGMPPPGWIERGNPRGAGWAAWCWPTWGEPLRLAAVLDLLHADWGWGIGDAGVTAHRSAAEPVTGLWAAQVRRTETNGGKTVQLTLGPAQRVG